MRKEQEYETAILVESTSGAQAGTIVECEICFQMGVVGNQCDTCTISHQKREWEASYAREIEKREGVAAIFADPIETGITAAYDLWLRMNELGVTKGVIIVHYESQEQYLEQDRFRLLLLEACKAYFDGVDRISFREIKSFSPSSEDET